MTVKKSILSIMSEACDAAGFPTPKKVYGSNDRISRLLRTAASASTRDILAQMPNCGLSSQTSTWVFRTAPGQSSYSLPPDFYSMLPDTMFRDTWPAGMLGPTPSLAWARWRAGFSVPAYPFSWRVLRDRVHLEPVPSTSELITVEYMSKFPAIIQTTGWDNQLWDGLPGDHAKAPYVSHGGHLAVTNTDLGLTEDEFNAKFRLLDQPDGWDSSSDLDGDGYPDAFVRKEQFSSDEDLCAFDPDIFAASMIWRLARGLGKPYQQEKLDYDRIIASTSSVDNGGLVDIVFSSPNEAGDSVLFPEDGSGRVVIL